MMRFLVRSRKCFVSNVAVWASCVNFLSSTVCYTQELDDKVLAETMADESTDNSPGYTVNFNNVPVTEVIRFVSKITGTNFVFQDEDVQFNVTIVSEEPITVKNIISALIQVLRVHDLTLLEQDNSLLITKSTSVNQIPTIISSDLPDSVNTKAPIVTRVFRIKNANVASIANIIRPLTSKTALIEVSNETRQLIVTDITTNVDKISSLLASLDAPHTPLEIESYSVKNISPVDIIALTTQLLSPFTEGNPLIFVPQADTNTIFIVSTPYLIERALSVMEDVDVAPQATPIGKPSSSQSVYVYKIQHRAPDTLMAALEEVILQLKEANAPSSGSIITALQGAKYISDTNSIMFVTDAETWGKIQEILAGIDTAGTIGITEKSHFLLYTPKYQTGPQLEASIQEMTENLKKSGLSNASLINALESMKWVDSTKTLVFTGNPDSLSYIKEMLATFDSPSYGQMANQVLIYKPQYASEDQLQKALERFAQTLDPNSISDQNLSATIHNAEWVPESQSFVFKGDATSITRLKEILASLDNAQGLTGGLSKGFYLYKLKHAPGDIVIQDLKNLSDNVSSSEMVSKEMEKSINNLKWVKENNSILITGSAPTIEQVKALIEDFDVPTAESYAWGAKTEFYIYKPIHLSPDELQGLLSDMASDLQAAGLSDPNLVQTLTQTKIVSASNSLIFTGTADSLNKVKAILPNVDVASGAPIQTIGATTFLIYKIQRAEPTQLITSIKNFAQELQQSNVQDKELAQALESAKYVKETNSLLLTGTQEALSRAEKLLDKFDVPPTAVAPREAPSTYVVYNPKYVPGMELISILCDFMQNLVSTGVSDPSLFDSINHLRFIDKTNSLVITGDQNSIAKVEQLLQKFDTPSHEPAQPSISTIESANFLIYKLQYHKGSEIQAALKQVGASLNKSATPNTKNLIDAIDSLQWIEVTNSLLGTGGPDILAKLKGLIQNLDVPLRQVFIEVLVIETSLLNSQNFGLQWGSQLQYLNKTIGAMGNFPLSAATAQNAGNQATSGGVSFAPSVQGTTASTPPVQGPTVPNAVPFSTGFDLGIIGDIIMHKGKSFISLGALVNALQVDNASTVIMNPKIVAQDGHTATIFVGQNIPFTGSFVSNTGQNSTVQTSNIEYRDVGVNLSITPTLGTNNIITLEISQDISEQTNNTTTVQGSQVTGIQTTHRSMNTRVHVPDKHFLVLSGMIQDVKNQFRTGIPCLGGLPVVGALFSENDRVDSKANVIIFMRPFIIDSVEDYDRLTSAEEVMFKDNARIKVLKEQFDDGTEMIKSMENE